MYEAFRGMATRPREEPSDLKQQYLREFRKVDVPVLKGDGGPERAEAWMETIMKHFDTLGVPNEYRVEFAAYKLEDQAYNWWKQTKRL